jgi:hypothetical protein
MEGELMYWNSKNISDAGTALKRNVIHIMGPEFI